uniref:Glycoside hydrolase family 2 n=1 Tax=Pseudothermotoga hypogea TaxID=57487 RepID=A0A832I809_9THEM
MRLKLNEGWRFSLDGVHFVEVKLPHEVLWEKVKDKVKHVLYEKKLDLRGYERKRIILHFHGVDYIARIFVNDSEVFQHEGGYDAFKVDITKEVKFNGNDVVKVLVSDVDLSERSDVVAGKQDWYGNACGIIQQVELWIVDEVHVDSMKVLPRKDLKTIDCEVRFSDGACHEFEVFLVDPFGKEVLHQKVKQNKFVLQLENTFTWDLSHPYLYKFIVEFNGERIETRFGFRYIETQDDKILLNGEPIYIFGALDQNFYSDTHYTLPDRERLLGEMLKAKEMGLNLLRCHVKIPDQDYLDVADELGILVWIDLPYARQLDEKGRNYLERLLENALNRYANHPSFVMLSLINETWGIDLTENATEETKSWIRKFYEKAKALDPTRLYVDNSACPWNYHVVSDVDDYHFYNAFPYHNEQWKKRIEDFATGNYKTFLEPPNRELPKIVSEFGVWGLSDPKIWLGEWSEFPITVMGNSFEGSEPARAIEKMVEFHNIDDLIYQAQLHQFLGLKYQAEVMRLYPSISGYVITEFSDIAWEANGLLDYNRSPKSFYHLMRTINQPIVCIIPNHRSILLEEQMYEAEVYLANNTSKKLEATLIVRTERKILKQTRVEIKPWSVEKITDVKAQFEPNSQNVFVELFEGERLLSRNFYPIMVLDENKKALDIVWVNKETFSDEELLCVREDEKIYGVLDFSGDWLSAITIFNTKRHLNISALLWDLGELATGNLLVPKNFGSISSQNSLISKIVGWGYAVASLLYVREGKEGKRILTTLKECEISKRLIGEIV